jgi:hypothetical protein
MLPVRALEASVMAFGVVGLEQSGWCVARSDKGEGNVKRKCMLCVAKQIAKIAISGFTS